MKSSFSCLPSDVIVSAFWLTVVELLYILDFTKDLSYTLLHVALFDNQISECLVKRKVTVTRRMVYFTQQGKTPSAAFTPQWNRDERRHVFQEPRVPESFSAVSQRKRAANVTTAKLMSTEVPVWFSFLLQHIDHRLNLHKNRFGFWIS